MMVKSKNKNLKSPYNSKFCQELGKTELSQNDSSLDNILANLLNNENLVTSPLPIRTNDIIYTHGNCTSCSETDMNLTEQDEEEKDVDNNCTSCTSIITEV